LKLLKEAVDEIKGEKTESAAEVKIDVDLELYFPNDYVPFSQQKVELYQKLAQAEDFAAINDLRLEVIDRFGPLPKEAENLFSMAEIKILARRIGLAKFVFRKKRLVLVYPEGKLPSKAQVSNLSGKTAEPIEYGAVGEFTITIDFSRHEDNDWTQKFKFVLQLLQ